MNQFSPSHENEKLEFQIVAVPNFRKLRTIHINPKVQRLSVHRVAGGEILYWFSWHTVGVKRKRPGGTSFPLPENFVPSGEFVTANEFPQDVMWQIL